MASSLQQRMADNGFESNVDYSYLERRLKSQQQEGIRCIAVTGSKGRRKTAFATAFAAALDYKHRLYHDFSQPDEPSQPLHQPARMDPSGAAIPFFERVMNDACAFSEAEPTILILDQLQQAHFREHIRLYRFLQSRRWHSQGIEFAANAERLLLFLISEEILYHSLQKMSFRVWVGAAGGHGARYVPSDLGLDERAAGWLTALHTLFVELGVEPTRSEYRRIVSDIRYNVRSTDDLAEVVYGWTEAVEREALLAPPVRSFMEQQLMPLIEDYLGVSQICL